MDDAWLEAQIANYKRAEGIVTTKLYEKVVSSYDQFLSAMTQIQRLESDLQMTAVLCTNGRRNLKNIDSEVFRCVPPVFAAPDPSSLSW